MMVKGVKGVNWLLYRLYCYRNGLSEGQLKVFIQYMKEGLKDEY